MSTLMDSSVLFIHDKANLGARLVTWLTDMGHAEGGGSVAE